MNMDALTKAHRREIRRLAGLAHERELSTAAGSLESEFGRWRRGEIDVFQLNEQVHKFHDGVSRELYKAYAMGRPEFSVAGAIHRGVLKESEVDPAVLEGLRGLIGLAGGAEQENEA